MHAECVKIFTHALTDVWNLKHVKYEDLCLFK